MDAKDLITFETVARLGGMGRAARELNTVQSNVTARVRRLETALGVPLFKRSRAGATLTQAGQTFVYEVIRPGDEPCWRWSDSYRQTLRIHTKQVDQEQQ